MDQKYKFQNGYSKSMTQSAIEDLQINSDGQISAKLKTFQTHMLITQKITNKLLKSLSDNDLQKISSLMDTVYLGKREFIYRADESVNFLYFPETAVISEYQILKDGNTVELSMTGNEGMIGFSSIFNLHKSPHWFQVLIPGYALRIDAEKFHQQFENSKMFEKMLFRFVDSYILQISQRIICNNHHTIEKRMCNWLLALNNHCNSLNLPITQEQIASVLGIHRPNVTLIVKLLREKNIISCSRGKILILDKPGLEEMSCDCYLAGE